MTPRTLAALALLALCSPAARAGDLDGVWLPVTAELGGRAFPDEVRRAIRLEIRGDRYTLTLGGVADRGTCKLDPSATPKALDITGVEGPNAGKTILAIYERDGDALRVCYDLGGERRPAEFKTAPGTQLFLVEYRPDPDPAATPADEPGFRPIFNGKDLTGWTYGAVDLAGKTATDDGRFAVRDGVLAIAGSTETPPKMTEIDTGRSYDGDFTLRFEFRASENANSGLHLRDKLFAHQLQIRDYPRVGPYKDLKRYRPGDWNAIEVAVTGDKARCTCNGERLEAALEIPEKGPISLQSETNLVEYRNIRIKTND